MLRVYLERCADMDQKPDLALLMPIAEKLQQMDSDFLLEGGA